MLFNQATAKLAPASTKWNSLVILPNSVIIEQNHSFLAVKFAHRNQGIPTYLVELNPQAKLANRYGIIDGLAELDFENLK